MSLTNRTSIATPKFDINEINDIFSKIISRHGKRGEEIREEFMTELSNKPQFTFFDTENALNVDYLDLLNVKNKNVIKNPEKFIMVDVWDALKGVKVNREYRPGITRNVIVAIDIFIEDEQQYYIVHDPIGVCEYSTWEKVEEIFAKNKWIGQWVPEDIKRPEKTFLQWEDDLDEEGGLLNRENYLLSPLGLDSVISTSGSGVNLGNPQLHVYAARGGGKSIFNKLLLNNAFGSLTINPNTGITAINTP